MSDNQQNPNIPTSFPPRVEPLQPVTPPTTPTTPPHAPTILTPLPPAEPPLADSTNHLSVAFESGVNVLLSLRHHINIQINLVEGIDELSEMNTQYVEKLQDINKDIYNLVKKLKSVY